ncbi:MAG: putative neuraminidase [Gemmatimonadetes bacterium]|nr:putative neuraminidase [Gemmatimonadota bacterium]
MTHNRLPAARLTPPRRTLDRICMAGVAVIVATLTACSPDGLTDSRPAAPSAPSYSSLGSGSLVVVNVSNDTTAQNETPLAVNPTNSQNLITGNNDWNYNDGCGVNASLDGGKTWTKTLPSGFVPGITKYTNDPSVAGTGNYDYGGDPAVAFSPDGRTAYFACFGYQGTPPYGVALLLSRSTDGGITWTAGGSTAPLTLVSNFTGNGQAKGSTGQFPDHESIHVAKDGTIYIPWAQFTGSSGHSPIYVATSRDGGASFSAPVQVTSGSVHSDQDARIVTDPATGYAYLTFDNSILGGKGTALFVSISKDRGATWSTPVRFGTFQNPVCLYPPYCFNITGNQFRGPGSYPVPAFDPTSKRLFVAYTDIVGGKAQIFLTSANVSNLAKWSTAQTVAPASGDRINVEMSIEPTSGRIDLMANDRSWSGNTLFDITYFGSADGGTTWAVQRVTKSSWDPAQYGVPSGSGIRPFIGDYDGIVSTATSAGLTWTGPGKTTGALPTNLEVYFASVTP